MTLSRPRTTRRVLRGSALGLGLLVAGGVTAPAAFAVVDPTATPTEVPVEGTEDPAALQDVPDQDITLAEGLSGDFGRGKDFTVQVVPQNDFPADLDLSGAVFQATPAGGGPPAPSTTDQAGACSFTSAHRGIPLAAMADRVDTELPLGTYTLTQLTTTPGLSLATGSKDFTLCSPLPTGFDAQNRPTGMDIGCQDDVHGDVEVDSLFRTSLVTTVLDEDTDEPIAGAGYTLTAPDYPHRTDLDGETDGPMTLAGEFEDIEYPVQVSDADGVLTFPAPDTESAWFLPGAGYTLTPAATPDGYTADTTYAFAVSTTARQAALGVPVPLTRLLGIGLAAGAPAPVVPGSGGVAAGSSGPAAAATTTASGAAAAATTPASTQAGTAAAALATTGSPVGTMALLGGGLVALGGSALVAGSTLRRRARRSA